MVYGLFYLIFAYCILLMKFFRALRSNELNKLNKRFNTIGNYYLIKNSSNSIKCIF